MKTQNTPTEPLDESWIQRLWNWADINHVPAWKGIPREKEKLLSVTGLNLIPEEMFDDEIGYQTSAALLELPPEIGRLVGLRQIIIEHGFLSELPAEIGNLINLNVLSVENNFSFKIPAEIGLLINLEDLSLSCSAEDIYLPPEVWLLTNLESLYIFCKQIEIMPQIENLKKLKSLELYVEKLSELPGEVINLLRLKTLRITVFEEPLNLTYEQTKWITRLKENGCLVELRNVFFQDEPWDL